MKPPLLPGRPDDFQTPPEALEPLYKYLSPHSVIWEPAAGKGNLVSALKRRGFSVRGTDILSGTDFLTCKPPRFDCIITNPPFSLKQEFLERCYSLKKPFALLLPITALETYRRQRLFIENGIEVIFFDKRVHFEVPNREGSNSWFATAWFTHGLRIGKQITFESLATEQAPRDVKSRTLPLRHSRDGRRVAATRRRRGCS